MNAIIINRPLILDLYGFSGTAINKDYSGVAFKLMDKMWKTIKDFGLKNKGLNTWVYDPDETVFAGVELTEAPSMDTGLEHRTIILARYAYYKHIGPYNLIKHAGQNMRDELTSNGFEIMWPYIEIYGHWANDESKLETELLMCLK